MSPINRLVAKICQYDFANDYLPLNLQYELGRSWVVLRLVEGDLWCKPAPRLEPFVPIVAASASLDLQVIWPILINVIIDFDISEFKTFIFCDNNILESTLPFENVHIAKELICLVLYLRSSTACLCLPLL